MEESAVNGHTQPHCARERPPPHTDEGQGFTEGVVSDLGKEEKRYDRGNEERKEDEGAVVENAVVADR